MIPYGKHHISQGDVDAVVEVLQHQFITQGEQVPAFEEALSTYTGARYATAVHSGTAGLHIACLALGVSIGDIVWTVPNSFVASANCALYCGATIDFVDIDADTKNINPVDLANKLIQAKANGSLPKALIVVHFAGEPCDMKTIFELCQSYGVAVIEDACHALGGDYDGQKIGTCQYSDITVLSFHPVKSITTAEGGAVLTNSPELASRCQLFGKHGVTRDDTLMSQPSQGPWDYQQLVLGYNYRMSDLHAALGISQLKRLDLFIQKRREKAQFYHQHLASLPITLPRQSEQSAWHLYCITLKEHDRKSVFEQLRAHQIGVNVHYKPIHLQPFYQQLGFKEGDYPAAEAFYEKALTIPLFPDLTADEQTRVIDVLHEVLG